MHELQFTLKTTSPVIVAVQSGEKVLTETRNYFPGSIVRGFLAAKYVRTKRLGRLAHEEETFSRWFLSGALRFLPAYPAAADGCMAAIPVPYCLYQNKDGDSFLSLADEDSRKTAKGYKAMRGFAQMRKQRETLFLRKMEPKRRIRFHLSRNSENSRLSGTAAADDMAKNGVFNYEALDEGQFFCGSILGTEQELKALRAEFSAEMTVTAGRSKYVQYGECTFKFGEVKTAPVDTTAAGDERVQIVCHTPLVLTNRCGLSEPSAELLTNELSQCLGGEVWVAEAFAATETIEQFVGIWGMRRPSVRAFSAGTVFALRAEGGWSAARLEKLIERGYQGVGCRQAEGFGQFRLLQGASNYVLEGREERRSLKPSGMMPELLQTMLKDMAGAKMKYQVQMQALQDAEQYLRSSSDTEAGTSLASKLEATLHEAADASGFMQLVTNYHEHAAKRLRRLRGAQGSLYRFLTTQEKPYAQGLATEQEWSELTALSGWTPETDAAFGEVLYRAYWQSFFRHMRKGLKASHKGGAVYE